MPQARIDAVRAAMPELPAVRRRRLVDAYQLTPADAAMLTQVRPSLGRYFEEAVRAGADPRAAKNWVLGLISAKLNELGLDEAGQLAERVPAGSLAALLALRALRLDPAVKLLPCTANNKEKVKEVLLELLYSILAEMETPSSP